MATTRAQIQSVAAENARLCQTLSETAYSISAYEQSSNYVKTLKKQIAASEKELKDIDQSVQKEYADHQKYRDSHVKRFGYKLGGKKLKFEEEATKEEKEWLDAVALQLKTKKGLEALNANLADVTKTTAEHEAIVQVHKRAQAELDTLYNTIFEGPTPDIPEEDAKENQVNEAMRNFDGMQMHLSTDTQARAILVDADRFLSRALLDIQDARSSATADAWGFGGKFSEMAESSALGRCQQHVSQVEMLISQAQRVQPSIRPIGQMRIAQMDFLSNVVFDNIFSDLAMRDRIDDSMRQLTQARANLQGQIRSVDERMKVGQGQVNEAKRTLDEKRKELQEIRASAFERLANHGVGESTPQFEGAPPAYAT